VNGEKMASLWQFFGLPDPDGQLDEKKRPKKVEQPLSGATDAKPAQQQTLNSGVSEPPQVNISREQPIQLEKKTLMRNEVKPSPSNWSGPLTAEGEAFHDLGAHTRVKNSFPRRALRYISPDEMNRIPTREMAKRILQGDSVIVDLRPMVHMDTHQNVCRRDLQRMSNETGTGVFALDAEDKLLLLPGTDVVVDVERHELGLLSLMSE
jgi:hypothetical protein|tara:strand:+ start:215 stop:838 length:624 start_codon:yes stop_codon:yes gene_type:complete